MDQIEGMFCKLCLENLTPKSFQAIGEVMLEVISDFSLHVSLDEDNNYICNDCSAKLFAAFHFKATCLDTEDSLFPYLDSNHISQVDLRDVYLKVKGPVIITSDQQVCRLCMNIVDDGFMSLEELGNANMVNKYIPQINFSITKDPVICKRCWNSLRIHTGWLSKWMCMDKKIKTEVQDPDDDIFVEGEETDLKFEEDAEDGELPLHESNENVLNVETTYENCAVKEETENSASTNIQAFQPSNYPQKSADCSLNVYNCKKNLLIHGIRHRNPSKVKKYQCDKCDYQTNQKPHLLRHQLRHRDPSEVKKYKCDKCDYQGNQKEYLLKHQLRHKDPSEVRMYKCDKCDYQVMKKDNLIYHQLLHRDASEVQMYKCDKCNYQTRFKHNLRKHQLLHKDPSEVRMYKCDKCDFQTKSKGNLSSHQLRHKDPSEVQMYKCDKCDYQTKWKSHLTQHQIRHRNPSEVQMYKCDECDYQTKWKNHLPQHQIRHRDPSEVANVQM